MKYPVLSLSTPQFQAHEDELRSILNGCGFAYLGKKLTEDACTLTIARYGTISRKRIGKLLRCLNQCFGIKELYFHKQEIKELEQFKKEHHIMVGNGWRSFLIKDGKNIKKIFLEHPQGAEIETQARTLLQNNHAIIPILEMGKDYITMPFEENTLKWKEGALTLYPLKKFDEIYTFMEHIFHNGICLVDWNYHSFIFARNGLRVCDLEHAYQHNSDEKISPDFSGKGHPKTGLNHVNCTFDGLWKSVLALSYQEYTTYPRPILHLIRAYRWAFFYLPKRLFKRISSTLQNMKYMFTIKQEDAGEYIKYSKRF